MTRTLALASAAALMVAPAHAQTGDGVGLDRVWSRLADVNGELGSVESAEFSPDAARIVTGTKFDNTVRVFRTADGAQLWTRTVPQEIERVAWTSDGARVASVSEDGLMRVFDAETGAVVARHRHDNGIDGLAASPDGRFLVSGQERVEDVGIVRVFDGRGERLLARYDFPGTVNEVTFTRDGRRMAAVGDHAARIYEVEDDPEAWRVIHEFALPNPAGPYGDGLIYINAGFSPDGRMLAAGAAHGFVQVYDTEGGERLRTLRAGAEKTETVAWSADGAHLLVAGNGLTIDVFATDAIRDDALDDDQVTPLLRVPVTDALEYMDFNDQGTLLTTAHQDGTVQLWTYRSGDPTLNGRQHRKVRAEQDAAARAAGRYVE